MSKRRGGVGRTAADRDGEILRLFRQWIAEHRAAEKIPTTTEWEEAFDAAIDRIGDIEHAIADIPASGPVGFAVKTYLACHYEHQPGHGDDPAGVSLLNKGFASSGDPGRSLDSYSSFHCIAAVIRDAARFVPEIGELAGPVINPSPELAAAEAEWVRRSILGGSVH
jgi:hypothetical protein